MTAAINILTRELAKIEDVKRWTEESLKEETHAGNISQFKKHIANYGLEISEVKQAIELLEKTL